MAGITEGVASQLPAATNTLPASAPLFHGLAADATTNPAFWAQRSAAAGDALHYRYVAACGLYLSNGTAADRAVNAAGIASGKGLAVTLFGPTGTAGLMPNAAALADGDANPTTTRTGSSLLVYNGATWDRVRAARTDGTGLSTGMPAAGAYVQDAGSGTWAPVRNAASLSDANAGTVLPGAAGLVYNGATFDRARAASATGINVGAVGVPAASPHLWNASASAYYPAYAAASVADASGGAVLPIAAGARYNGATWDRMRNNTEGTLLASAARTATTATATQTNHDKTGVLLVLNVTAASGTGGLQVQVQHVDPISGLTIDLTAVPTAITATGRYAYELGPGAAAAGVAGTGQVQQSTQRRLPRSWRANVGHLDASSYAYSLSFSLQ